MKVQAGYRGTQARRTTAQMRAAKEREEELVAWRAAQERETAAKRLGSSGGAAEVRESPALLGLAWKAIAAGSAQSPLALRATDWIRSQAPADADAEELPPPDHFPPAPSAAWCEAEFSMGEQ